MFPTFSGNSRRLRNVNLSGQRHSNPFAAHSLSPSTGLGASKTVADAQAGRRQRQQEREELKAARLIQRSWRGHRSRRQVKAGRREALKELYSSPNSGLSRDDRIQKAFPLLLSSFDDRDEASIDLLYSFSKDLASTNYSAITSGQLPQSRLWHLVRTLTLALNHDRYVGTCNFLEYHISFANIYFPQSDKPFLTSSIRSAHRNCSTTTACPAQQPQVVL